MTIPVTFNREFLTAREGDANFPSSITDAVINNADVPEPYYKIPSATHNTNGYRGLIATALIGLNEQVAVLNATLENASSPGFYPSDEGQEGRGSFVGMLRFNIRRGVNITDASLAGFA